MAIIYNGDVAVVLDTQHRTPGNLRAFVQASIRSIKTGMTTSPKTITLQFKSDTAGTTYMSNGVLIMTAHRE